MHLRSSFTLALAVAGAAISSGQAAADEEPQPVYHIRMEASFDPATGRISAVERMRWHNTASVPVESLQLHLYLNAFANNRSTFMIESGGQLRGQEMEGNNWGFSEVESIRVLYADESVPDAEARDEGQPPRTRVPEARGREQMWPLSFAEGVDLKGVEEIIRPDDGNLGDRTSVRYPLPRPLGPGEAVDVEIAFSAQLPEVFARTGVHGDYVLAGQWFPKIGVFEDAGARGRAEPGWNTHQFHAHSEFFADFGNWDVSLTMPARYRGHIGATGRLVDERVEGDSVTARFVQDGVHDFAWTADPKFVVVEDRFDPATDVTTEQQERIAALLGLSPEELTLEPVDIRLMLRPEHRSQAHRYIESAKAALRGFGLRLGAYPYDTLTLVDPARGAFGSGGMEYPTFITLGTHPLLNLPPFRKMLMAEAVTVHEFGHNFFQGMIASNEFEEAWIDEGMTSYYEMVVMEEEYGVMVDLLGMRVTPFEASHSSLRGGRYTDAVVQPSWSYRSGDSYGLNSYARPAVTLRHLENLLGPEVFHRTMRRFFQTWRYRHPSTEDFKRLIQAETEEDIGWFLEQALHTDHAVDYGVGSARSTVVRDAEGLFWEQGERRLVETDPDGAGVAEEGEEVGEAGEPKPEGLFRTEVVIQRYGEFRHPVTVELEFEDGERLRKKWDGQGRWVRFTESRASRLASVEVDPDQILALDVNRLNNSRRLDKARAPAAKLLVHLLFWMQNLLDAVSILG